MSGRDVCRGRWWGRGGAEGSSRHNLRSLLCCVSVARCEASEARGAELASRVVELEAAVDGGVRGQEELALRVLAVERVRDELAGQLVAELEGGERHGRGAIEAGRELAAHAHACFAASVRELGAVCAAGALSQEELALRILALERERDTLASAKQGAEARCRVVGG